MEKPENFFQMVYAVVRQIPFGRVTSYGAIAEYLGAKSAARMVGWAMNGSHLQAGNLPAHRVVNRNGLHSGKAHFGGNDLMAQLLENEGVIIENDRIVNFSERFWDPSVELGEF